MALEVGHRGLALRKTRDRCQLDGRVVRINNPAGEEVHIFGMNGAELNADKSGNASIKMAMPADNSFIVKVGKQSIKIAVIK